MKQWLPFVFLFAFSAARAQATSVLFVGNSYTYTNNLPDMVYQLARAHGDSIAYNSSTPGGYTFQMHSQYAPTLSLLNQQPWSYVILQGQSQEPSLDTAYVETNVFPYAAQLDSLAHVNAPCTQTIFFMTWGRKNGDAQNCAAYPPVCTFAGMQDQLRGRYVQMAHDNHAIVAPVGEAWRNVIATNPAFDLYSPDESHPSVYGTYLTACVFYATIYRQSPAGLNYYGGLPQTDALLLQTIAGSTVLDSTPVWNTEVYYPDAAFTAAQGGPNAVTVTANDPSVTGWSWDDGTGNGFAPGNATETFTYAMNGNYTICLAATNGCRADTFCMTVNPATVGVAETDFSAITIFPNPSDGNVQLSLPGETIFVTICNASGQLVFAERTTAQFLSIEGLAAGIYVVAVERAGEVRREKLIITR